MKLLRDIFETCLAREEIIIAMGETDPSPRNLNQSAGLSNNSLRNKLNWQWRGP